MLLWLFLLQHGKVTLVDLMQQQGKVTLVVFIAAG